MLKNWMLTCAAIALAISCSACPNKTEEPAGDGGTDGGSGAATTAAITPAKDGEGATLSGKVTFKGEAPDRRPLPVEGNTYCKEHAEKAGAAPRREDIVVEGGNLVNAVVYIKAAGSGFTAPSTGPTLDQVGCVYTPHVVAVQTGQPLKIHNGDDTSHNVHSYAKKTGNPKFNDAQATKGMEMTQTFKTHEFVQVKCDVHSWMESYVAVFDHSFFAVTGKDGSFTLKNVPAGEWEVSVWHEKGGEKSQKIKVDAKATKSDIAFEYTADDMKKR